jgi:hypothetical protein
MNCITRANLIYTALAVLSLAAGVGCSGKSGHDKPVVVASLHNRAILHRHAA